MPSPHPTAVETEPIAVLANSAVEVFRRRWGQTPQWIAVAPGRVNLIGEHTDYNDGYVMPMAIERYVVIAAAPCADRASHFYSCDFSEEAEVVSRGKMERALNGWSSYVQGVFSGFMDRGFELPSINAVVQSTVPIGAGLSSSAALEVATATLLESVLQVSLNPNEKAILCQRAEQEFAGVPCGIMDQFSSVHGQKDVLMLLDCRAHEIAPVRMDDPNVTVLITDSKVRRELVDSEYVKRRTQCEESARILGVPSLRDATESMLLSAEARLDSKQYRRARHVITEIDRTLQAAEGILAGKWERVGHLMYDSHDSLRDDFEVSCQELDWLVDIAKGIGISGGVFGSRMTGAGFGGCTVSLVETNAATEIAKTIADKFFERTGRSVATFASRPAGGAHEFQLGELTTVRQD